MAGRPSLTPLQAAKSKASRAYWKWQELQNKMPGELWEDRVQYADSKKTMGRPPVKLAVQQDKARQEWESAISEYRELEASEGLEPITEQEIIEYKKKDSAGRPGSDQVDRIRKFIRRQERLIDQLQDEVDAGAVDPKNERGRPAKTRKEKIEEYRDRIKDAIKEIDGLVSNMPEHEQIKHQINELRVKSREITVFLKFELSHEAAVTRQSEVKAEIAKLAKKVGKDDIGLRTLKTENRHIAVFLNTKLDLNEAEEHQSNIKRQISKLEQQYKAALSAYKTKSKAESVQAEAEATEKSEQVRKAAYNRKYDEIEQRNQRLKATIARLKEQKALEDELRALGGDPDELDPIEKTG